MKTKALKKRAEMRFARLKTHRGSNACGCEALPARDELRLAAILQDLKTMALQLLGPSLNHPRAHARVPQTT